MFKLKKISLSQVILVSIIILFLSRLEFEDMVFGKNFHPQNFNETTRWMTQDGFVYIYFPFEMQYILNISTTGDLDSIVNVFLNDKKLGSYAVSSSINEQVVLKGGKNTLNIRSTEDCEPTFKKFKNSTDIRCVSIGIENITLTKKDDFIRRNESFYYGSGWYHMEEKNNETYRFIGGNATLLLPRLSRTKLNLTIESYNTSRVLGIYLNDELIDSYVVNPFFTSVITPEIGLNEDLNILELKTESKCGVPAKNENSTDLRCLTFSVKDIRFLSSDSLIKSNKTVIFSKNWYKQEKNKIWGSNNTTIFILSPDKRYIKLNFTMASYHRPREVIVYLNNRTISNYSMSKASKNILTDAFEIHSGENVLNFLSAPGCDVPFDVEKADDKRCLSFVLQNFEVLSIDELIAENKTILYGDNWYSSESYNGRDYTWMSQDATAYLIIDKPKLFRLNFTSWSYNRDRTAEIYLDDVLVGEYAIKKYEKSFVTPLIYADKGEHVLKIRILDGCETSDKDARCLSIALSKLEIDDVDNVILYIDENRNGWYNLEEYNNTKFIWSKDSSVIEILSLNDIAADAVIKLRSYHKEREAEFIFNNESFGKTAVPNYYAVLELKLNILKGKNIIQIIDKEGCDIPTVIEHSEDKRCLSFSFELFSVK